MRYTVLLLVCILTPSLGLGEDNAMPKFPESFSANVKMKAMGQENRVRFHKLGTKTRMEMDLEGVRNITIIDADTQTMTNLKPEQQIALQIQNPAISQDPMSELSKGNMTLTKVGPEEIEGVSTIKYVTETEFGQPIYVWLDEKQLPVRLGTPDGTVQMSFSKVKVDAPKASLFEIPEGYQIQKVDLNAMGGTAPSMSTPPPPTPPAPSP